MNIILEEEVKIVFTSAGNPKKYTALLKEKGVKVVHVVANEKFALKCVEAGVDAIVAEGFEAGGHNGFEETTTMALIPQIRKAIDIPLIAAGGIGSGPNHAGCHGFGSRWRSNWESFLAASEESSGHDNFKQQILAAKDGSTKLTLKSLVPVRLIRNKFLNEVEQLEAKGASKGELAELLGRGRAKLGMFSGDIDDGELEIGQISAIINEIKPVTDIIDEIIREFETAKAELGQLSF